jgi:hypothetical protein
MPAFDRSFVSCDHHYQRLLDHIKPDVGAHHGRWPHREILAVRAGEVETMGIPGHYSRGGLMAYLAQMKAEATETRLADAGCGLEPAEARADALARSASHGFYRPSEMNIGATLIHDIDGCAGPTNAFFEVIERPLFGGRPRKGVFVDCL